jgi:hypothetical protein
VRVGLLDEESRPIPGRSIDDCIPVVGDFLSRPIKWKSGTDVGVRAEKPTRLRFELTHAELYSFQIVPQDS